MRKAMRFRDNRDYWDQRWADSGSDATAFINLDIYPIKYAEMVKPQPGGCIAELGCGLGRLVKHYHSQGFLVVGLERSSVAVQRMKADDGSLRVLEGDAAKLPFAAECFDTVLAFGLYHNMEFGMKEALGEAVRCLKRGGTFAISTRPDNFEMRLNERFWRWKETGCGGNEHFHKWLIEESEFSAMLTGLGLMVEAIHRARNVSIFWRLPLLRADLSETHSESGHRSEGYRLNFLGRMVDGFFSGLFPASFCNVLVYTGRRS